MNEFIEKYKTCHKGRDALGWGTIFVLSGCVAFWNLRCHKMVRQINEEYGILTPEQLNAAAWGINIGLKSIGAGLYLKALSNFNKCK